MNSYLQYQLQLFQYEFINNSNITNKSSINLPYDRITHKTFNIHIPLDVLINETSATEQTVNKRDSVLQLHRRGGINRRAKKLAIRGISSGSSNIHISSGSGFSRVTEHVPADLAACNSLHN